MRLKLENFENSKDGFVFVVKDDRHEILSMFLKYTDANNFVDQYRYERGEILSIAKYCMKDTYSRIYWSPSITTEQEVKGNCVVGKEIFDHVIVFGKGITSKIKQGLNMAFSIYQIDLIEATLFDIRMMKIIIWF